MYIVTCTHSKVKFNTDSFSEDQLDLSSSYFSPLYKKTHTHMIKNIYVYSTSRPIGVHSLLMKMNKDIKCIFLFTLKVKKKVIMII